MLLLRLSPIVIYVNINFYDRNVKWYKFFLNIFLFDMTNEPHEKIYHHFYMENILYSTWQTKMEPTTPY